MRLPPNDYLKYWRVIRYFILKKYKLTTGELDVLLFLYSEKYFSKDKFNEFDELISWDVNRFDRLLRDGWVVVFRKRQGKKKALYEVSYKGRRMLGSMYKKLSGEEIPESPSVNPMFLKNVSYTDKVYRNMIIEMNKFIRQQRHPSP
jgi:DNA-binding MarR family transcriptional regulator|tara:strand:- start:17 stop:457 length:441 start_codon:yes stop_codon:yes gene_type:complete